MIKIFGSSVVGTLCGVYGYKYLKEQKNIIKNLKKENEIQKHELTYLKLKLETLTDIDDDEMYIMFNNKLEKMMDDRKRQMEEAKKKFDKLDSEIEKLNNKNHKAISKIINKL